MINELVTNNETIGLKRIKEFVTDGETAIRGAINELIENGYIEREMREVFGTKVKINNKKIEISFNNNNDLDRILDIMNIKID
jgi:CTP-dependent riboflavin kinase